MNKSMKANQDKKCLIKGSHNLDKSPEAYR